MQEQWECVVVGAGAAGLSAALVLGRARRRTLVIDDGEQSNRASRTIGGLLGYDQRPPDELYSTGRQELSAYPNVELRRGRVCSGERVDNGFRLQVEGGEAVNAKRVLLATGMQYCPPDLPGLAELWGTSVFQCPFCHGWEMRDKRLATLAAGEEAVHSALLLRGWTDDVVLLTDGRRDLAPDDVNMLTAAGIAIDDRRVVELLSAEGTLTEIAFADGDRLARDGLLVEAPLRQRSELATQLGATCTPGELGTDPLDIDAFHRADTGGVFAAGDNCTKSADVAGAVYGGSTAGKLIVQSLLADEFGLPFPPS